MGDVTAPRVSIVIACFNLGEYLDEAVASVLTQTYQDFEIVIVDDGSTDPATQALLATYAPPKTRVIRAPHAGLAAARNTGIAAARGRYLSALDADDRLDSAFLARMVPVLDEDPGMTFASCWLRTFGEEHWEWTPARCDLPTLLLENTVLTAALVRRDAVISVGGYDTGMPVQGDEDWDLWLTLVERGYRGSIVPEVLFNYRRRAGSMSTICWYGPGHLPLMAYRLAKHRDSYERHLHQVLLHQDANTAPLLRRNDELERYLGSQLDPVVTLRRQELSALQTKAQSPSPVTPVPPPEADTRRVRELEAALRATCAEVTALRTSMSWRATAPLRTVYGWWLRWRASA